MKFLTTIITGIIVGAFGIYFTLDWQEESLEFSITSPAKFGEIKNPAASSGVLTLLAKAQQNTQTTKRTPQGAEY